MLVENFKHSVSYGYLLFNGAKTLYVRFLFVLVILCSSHYSLNGQNSDLGLVHSSGKYRGMANAAIGATEIVTSFDTNPAGLADISRYKYLSFSHSIQYYSYALYRNNEGIGAINFDWNKIRYNPECLLLATPGIKNIALGIGYLKKTNIYINNYKRAITWSSLFNHKTTDGIYALAFSSGFKINQQLSLGLTFYRYFGTITSEIKGENHGTDADKWAILSNRFEGWNYRIGAILKLKDFNAGFIFESANKLNVSAQKKISEDRLYEYLFPSYNKTKWRMPFIIGIGIVYKGLKNFLVTFDFENMQYEKSNLQPNLFEFGGQPIWKDINIFRLGAEILSFPSNKLPLRFGYAYIPQLYASNNSIGEENIIVEYKNTRQNIKHLLTIGTTIRFSKFIVNIALEHSSVKWHRNLITRMYIEDEYNENIYVFSSELVYYFE